ncbi:MAG: Uma2 family endonuclease [Planctomycetales bacterium]|nr:Uma2 family endonuclease [Planctomycetales bacterium]
MSTVPPTFTLEQYEHMVSCGAFDGAHRRRVELLHGEILEITPVGFAHANTVCRLVDWSYASVDLTQVAIRSQTPIRILVNQSEPEPDVVWVRNQPYTHHPNPSEVLLLIEVADTSLAFDRGEKLSAYAQAGIADYWIVNLKDSQVEVYRDPRGADYRSKSIYRPSKPGPNPLAAPAVTLSPNWLF